MIAHFGGIACYSPCYGVNTIMIIYGDDYRHRLLSMINGGGNNA